MRGDWLLGGLAAAGLVALVFASSGPKQKAPESGLIEADHARKIEPWIVRLRAARDGLREAVQARDRARVLRQMEDVWFWVGRLTAEVLAVEDPKYDALRLRGAQAIIESQREVATARAAVLSRA